jgi:type 2A phosphatase activator TIP41
MKDCFFGLLRSYLRVDNVLVRIIDTRIFHSFGDNYIFRDFQVKENSFEALYSKGFKFSSEWSLSQGQSDIVSRYLDVTYSTKDKIMFDY